MNKVAATVVGLTFFGLLMLGLLWSIFGGYIKAYTPNEWGYSRLGWVRCGAQTVHSIGVPKWAGWEGFLSTLQAPFRHYKIYLKQGQRLVADYHVRIERGAIVLAVYRTNMSRILQGSRVENHRFQRLRPGHHIGRFEYTAPANGIYRFDYDIRWDYEANRGAALPMPDYELVYDIRWRLERN